MKSLSLDSLWEWNPQLFREIKGRFKRRNIVIAISISLLIQFLTFVSLDDQPGSYQPTLMSQYCTLDSAVVQYVNTLVVKYREKASILRQKISTLTPETFDFQPTTLAPEEIEKIQNRLSDLSNQLKTKLSKPCPKSGISMQFWRKVYWSRFLIRFSLVNYFIIIIAGTYLLIQDFAIEEKRGNLNLLRLNPQPYYSIFWGKLLGVPSLLYLGMIVAFPIYLYAGLMTQTPGIEIISFYLLMAASCLLIFSTALLFGLVTRELNGLKAWLGVGTAWFFQWVNNQGTTFSTFSPFYGPLSSAFNWLNIFYPFWILPPNIDRATEYLSYLYPSSFEIFEDTAIKPLNLFSIPIDEFKLKLILFLFSLVSYGLWTLGVWQGLKRSFRDQNATLLGKRHSYFMTTCFTLLNLGLAWQDFNGGEGNNSGIRLPFNLIWFLVLIVSLSPHRQTLQDWARYRLRSADSYWHHLWQDLMWGEKSPGIFAFAINLLIFAIFFSAAILTAVKPEHQEAMFLGLLFHISFIFILASIAQLILFLKIPKQGLWATATVSIVMIVPSLISGFLNADFDEGVILFFISVGSFTPVDQPTLTLMSLTLLGEFIIILMLNVQLTRLLKTAGESETKKLGQNA